LPTEWPPCAPVLCSAQRLRQRSLVVEAPFAPFLTCRSDLKPANVLLNGADTDCPEVKLAVRHGRMCPGLRSKIVCT
jgi:hypothetical protein